MKPALDQTRPVTIVYDGLCNLCSRSMSWIARHLLPSDVRFIPVQSDEGGKALKAAGLDALDPESFLVIQKDQPLMKSRAVITIFYVIGGGWKIIAHLLNLLPVSWADKIYSWVAKNRYGWFGRRDTCYIQK